MRSGRQVGSTLTPLNERAIFWCQARSSSGSSVVQTAFTFDLTISERAEKSFFATTALHFRQIRSAEAAQSRSETPK